MINSYKLYSIYRIGFNNLILLSLAILLECSYSCQRSDKELLENENRHKEYLLCKEGFNKSLEKKYGIHLDSLSGNTSFKIDPKLPEQHLEFPNLHFLPTRIKPYELQEKASYGYAKIKEVDTINFKYFFWLTIILDNPEKYVASFWRKIPTLESFGDSLTTAQLIYPESITYNLPSEIKYTTLNGKKIAGSGQINEIYMVISTNDSSLKYYKLSIRNIDITFADNSIGNPLLRWEDHFGYVNHNLEISLSICLNAPEIHSDKCIDNSEDWFSNLFNLRGLGFLLLFNLIFLPYYNAPLSPFGFILRKSDYTFEDFMEDNRWINDLFAILCNLLIVFSNTRPFSFISNYFDNYKPQTVGFLLAVLIPIAVSELIYLIWFTIKKSQE